MPVWSSQFNEAPGDDDPASQGAGAIRDTRLGIHERLFQDHVEGDAVPTGADPVPPQGHVQVTFSKDYAAGMQPNVMGAKGYLFVREMELFWRAADGTEVNLSDAVTAIGDHDHDLPDHTHDGNGNGNGNGNGGMATAAELPAGSILDYGGLTAPTGYLLCDGAAVSRSTYSALFTAIAERFGAGDGSSTFNVPNFNRRVAVGAGGTGTTTLGALVGSRGGAEDHTLTIMQIPPHAHRLGEERLASNSGTEPTARGGTDYTSSLSTDHTGGGQAHNNIQPSLVVNKIIKT